MSTRLTSQMAFAGVVAASLLAASPASADPTAAVWGGGRAVVQNDGDGTEEVGEGFLPEGAVTEFGLNSIIDTDGTAIGEFTCIVHGGGGGLTADIDGGVDLGDGCVMLTGTSTCIFPTIGVFFDEPITLFVHAGGPGEGGFCLLFDNYAGVGFDEELVSNGVIMYHSPD